jgi:opacity protein-like surface antigen
VSIRLVGKSKVPSSSNESVTVDLGTWWCMTPFLGAGIGTARVSIANFTDQGIANNGGSALPGLAFGDNVAKWNFAWALHAGVAYHVNPNFTVQLAYRYLNMGDGLTGDLKTFDGTNNIVNPTTFKNISSQDLMLGVRWNLESPQVYAPPLIRKG